MVFLLKKVMIMAKVKIGDIYELKEGGAATVVEYEYSDRVVIKHNDKFGHVQQVQAGHLKRGNIKNPYFPSVHGIGYNGSGKHQVSIGRKHTRAYKKWRSMIERCYSEVYQKKKPSYKGCSVASEWHNFQNFAEWFYSNPYHDLDYELDKDILTAGNRVYSPKNCELVPRELNVFARSGFNSDGIPMGVSKRGDKFIARMYINSKSKHLGIFDSLTDAIEAYVLAKQEYGKQLAEKWKDSVSERVYQSLSNWVESDVDGKAVTDENGKIIKGSGYFKPELDKFVGGSEND